MSDLRDDLARAAHETGMCMTMYGDADLVIADAVLAVVQKRAEQLADELDNETRRRVLGTESRRQAHRAAFAWAAARVRAAFGLATREETNQ